MSTKAESLKASTPAIEASIRTIEATLGKSPAFHKVDERLYVVKQGSAYVMLVVLPAKEGRAIVRLAAQVVTGIKMSEELALKLLKLNSRLRFGAFGYQEDGQVVTLSHSILGGETLDADEILAALEDIAVVADDFDDRLVAAGGGSRMSDLIKDEAAARLQAEIESDASWEA